MHNLMYAQNHNAYSDSRLYIFKKKVYGFGLKDLLYVFILVFLRYCPAPTLITDTGINPKETCC